MSPTCQSLKNERSASAVGSRRSRFRTFAPHLIQILLGAVVLLKWGSVQSDPIRGLVGASSVAIRAVEPRLAGGFPWAPIQPGSSRGPAVSEPERLPLLAAAANLSTRSETDYSEDLRHALAVARILTGAPTKAVAELESLVRGRSNSARWTDLAAAQYVLARRDDEPERLTQALVAADAALQIDPAYPEARFNRALIIEALGLRDLAREEWERYLRLDSNSEWAEEAREHVHALAPEEEFDQVLTRDYDHLASDRAAARGFARRYPQLARTWGESEILRNWAEAEKKGDGPLAVKHLRVARALASELADFHGNRSFEKIVEAIDRAAPQRRQLLAEAHLHFGDGRRAFLDRRPGDAQRLFAAAMSEFAQGESPCAVRAHFYLANMFFEQGKLTDAESHYEQLFKSPPSEFPAHRAELLRMLGTVAYSEGRFGAAIDRWTESISLFEGLGELNHAAIARGQIVYALDRAGDPRRAWKNRMLMLRELGRQITTAQPEALASVTRAAVMDQDWPVALSVLRLEIEAARRIKKPFVLIQEILYRAEVYRRMNQRESAINSLSEARLMIDHVADAAYRSYLEAIADNVEGSFSSDPRTAIKLFTQAIEFQSTKGRRTYLVDLLIKRGRAYRSIGDDFRAASDFEAGVAELERHRESLPGGEGRWGIFHAADELFAEAISLALDRHDPLLAFTYAERARARSLFDTLGVPWLPHSLTNIPPDTTVVEYAAHGDSMVIFVAGERGVRAYRTFFDRTALAAEVETISHAATPLECEKAGRSLFQMLVEPVSDEILGKRSLVIVPDEAVRNVPFAALIDKTGRNLVETYALTFAPSAAFFGSPKGLRTRVDTDHALVVTGAAGLGRLSAAEREADAVAALYRRSAMLKLDAATPEQFASEAIKAGVIHFAGHGVASRGANRDGYLLLASHGTSDGRLDVGRIAAMPLRQTSVVVLAACGTAAGEVRSTEGTISIARAFLAAGVPNVIATLWPIDDEAAAEFFPVLHQHLAHGLAPAEALRATQMQWIRRGNQRASLWAAVQVIGR
ncbi:MAG: hypothetical protein QOE68_312 [Thermoanaerobaculia bacterium]|nr:hypothetical protein [Thermoanaerobaculia bacterium]